MVKQSSSEALHPLRATSKLLLLHNQLRERLNHAHAPSVAQKPT
jgi:hypothetical protein